MIEFRKNIIFQILNMIYICSGVVVRTVLRKRNTHQVVSKRGQKYERGRNKWTTNCIFGYICMITK